jgi:hypothetical protein
MCLTVPIIPDYLYTSEQKEYIPKIQNDVRLFSKEAALTNSSTLLPCLENPIPSEIPPTVQPASKSSLHRGEETMTMSNKRVISNTESEYHGHQIQSDIHSQNTHRQEGHVNVQQSSQQNTEDDHLNGNQYTKTIKQKAMYKRRDKDKYRNMVQHSDYLHGREIQHNNTVEGLNNTGQHSALQNWSEGAESKSLPSSKQASALSNCNFRYSTLHFGQGPLTTAIRDSIHEGKHCSKEDF